jgi:hypothetical protein
MSAAARPAPPPAVLIDELDAGSVQVGFPHRGVAWRGRVRVAAQVPQLGPIVPSSVHRLDDGPQVQHATDRSRAAGSQVALTSQAACPPARGSPASGQAAAPWSRSLGMRTALSHGPGLPRCKDFPRQRRT